MSLFSAEAACETIEAVRARAARLVRCSLLILLTPMLTPGLSAAAQEAAFDYELALEFSQSAIGRALADHRFTAASGESVSMHQFRGKPLVLSLVYTSCYQICPMTTRYLSDVVEKARKALGHDSFNIAVVGFDTEVDRPSAMQYFGRKQGVEDRGWYLLSADAQTIEALTRTVGFLYVPSSNGFDHLIQATIIDAHGAVYRQVYGQVFETPLLVDPLIELVIGKAAPPQPLLTDLFNKVKLFCTTYDPVRDGYYFDYSLFVGMLIGAVIILFAGTVVVRGLARH